MLPEGKSTLRRIYGTWSWFCGACWKYKINYATWDIGKDALSQHYRTCKTRKALHKAGMGIR